MTPGIRPPYARCHYHAPGHTMEDLISTTGHTWQPVLLHVRCSTVRYIKRDVYSCSTALSVLSNRASAAFPSTHSATFCAYYRSTAKRAETLNQLAHFRGGRLNGLNFRQLVTIFEDPGPNDDIEIASFPSVQGHDAYAVVVKCKATPIMRHLYRDISDGARCHKSII